MFVIERFLLQFCKELVAFCRCNIVSIAVIVNDQMYACEHMMLELRGCFHLVVLRFEVGRLKCYFFLQNENKCIEIEN